MERVTILLGSNQGNREEFLRQAIEYISTEVGNIYSLSNVYQSEAVGYRSENQYLNQALTVDTELAPQELLTCTQAIEAKLHRVRSITERYTDRTIDIDILFYGNIVIDTPRLTIPHPEIANREFVIRPLMDIIPTYEHPVIGESIEEIAKKIKLFSF